MTDRTITLTAEETRCLIEGGSTKRTVDGLEWRIAVDKSIQWRMASDRHISLSAAEVNIIARMPEGLIVGATTIRSEVAS